MSVSLIVAIGSPGSKMCLKVALKWHSFTTQSRQTGMAKQPQFGNIRKIRGKYQARYKHNNTEHTAGRMFNTLKLARVWLNNEQRLIELDTWTPPEQRRQQAKNEEEHEEAASVTLADYGLAWITNRQTPSGRALAPSTASEYRKYLATVLKPLAGKPLNQITRKDVERWWNMKANKKRPTLRHHAYSLLKSLMTAAMKDGLIDANPCQIDNASRLSRATPKAVRDELITSLTVADVNALADEITPSCWRFLVLLLAYCGLRPGEAFALRRSDISHDRVDGLERVLIHVQRAVSKQVESRPKTDGSIRTVPLPPHLNDVLATHLVSYAQPGYDGLVFPSTNPAMSFASSGQVQGKKAGSGKQGNYSSGWNKARETIGKPSLRLYDLRHWARLIWTRAGLDYATVEMLLGHQLPTIQGTYAHYDIGHAWTYARKVSEMTGWSPDVGRAQPVRIPDRLLNAMSTRQLGEYLSRLSDEGAAAVVPHIPVEKLMKLMGRDDRARLRIVE